MRTRLGMPVGEMEEGEELEPMEKGEFQRRLMELTSVSSIIRRVLLEVY